LLNKWFTIKRKALWHLINWLQFSYVWLNLLSFACEISFELLNMPYPAHTQKTYYRKLSRTFIVESNYDSESSTQANIKFNIISFYRYVAWNRVTSFSSFKCKYSVFIKWRTLWTHEVINHYNEYIWYVIVSRKKLLSYSLIESRPKYSQNKTIQMGMQLM
jgi:hypothetical protein